MIIISQDEKAIHNFNNIISIQVEERAGKYEIITYDAINDNTSLGSYKTEERAKEVLKSIVAIYQANKIFECTDRIEQNQAIEEFLKGKMLPFAYEMPEE